MAEKSLSSCSETPVATDRNWQHRVHAEMACSKEWSHHWGFMAASGKQQEQLGKFMAANSHCTSTLALSVKHGPPAVAHRAGGAQDAVDAFMQSYMRGRCKDLRPMPMDEFKQPALSSHVVGWGSNLEQFGRLTLHMR
mmetsp:Transcript_8963/g.27196  ORF Transcript_8963/g.27196 Transcript_8963/m.27196 type:complete len:138 (+) Transcript_8963:197-610(+)